MKLSSYVVVHDYGFAPNPFGKILTLATCKPGIRKTAKVGNWVMGTGSKSGIGTTRLIYAGRISEVVSIATYGSSSAFAHKIPNTMATPWGSHGDNIYFFDHGRWHQRRNPFHSKAHMERDLSGKNVIICEKFWYLGDHAVEIPAELKSLIKPGTSYKNNEDSPYIEQFLDWLQTLPQGRVGDPSTVRV